MISLQTEMENDLGIAFSKVSALPSFSMSSFDMPCNLRPISVCTTDLTRLWAITGLFTFRLS